MRKIPQMQNKIKEEKEVEDMCKRVYLKAKEAERKCRKQEMKMVS